jgi:cbb3-type cytochrome oxidase subunit 3
MPPASKKEFPKKSALAITMMFLVLAVVYSILIWFTSQEIGLQYALSQGSTLARNVAGNAEDALLTSNAIQLQLYVKNASLLPGVRSVIITDPGGKIVASDTSGRINTFLDRSDSVMESKNGVTFRRAEGETRSYEVRETIRPKDSQRVIGYVYVAVDPQVKEDPKLNENLAFTQKTGLALMALFFIGVLVVLWRSLSRLEEQANKAARMSALIDLVKDWDEDVLYVTVVPRNPPDKSKIKSKK